MKGEDVINQTFNVIIVGCGNIAGRFDMLASDVNLPLTHAGAYKFHGKFNILACIEPNERIRNDFMSFWGVSQGYSCLKDALNANLEPDVISICSPTGCHEQDILDSLLFDPQLIFCEKPITLDFEKSRELVDICESKNVHLAVNYNRRWDPLILDFKSKIEYNHYGDLRSVVGIYNKGLMNNGSHMVDLIQYLLGSLNVVAATGAVNDFFDQDPSVSAILNTENSIPVHLVTGNAKDYSIFELKFIFEKSVVTMIDGGQAWLVSTVKESRKFEGYREQVQAEQLQGRYDETFVCSVENIYKVLTSGISLNSTGHTALRAQEVCELIIQKTR